MRIAILSNIREQKGLYRDATILERLLDRWGHTVSLFDWRDVDRRDYHFTAVVHLEVVAPLALSWSDRQVWIPNPEWWLPAHARWVDAFRVVVAKTREGERVMREAGVKRIVYTGFEAEDRLQKHVKKERRFFHTFGGNINRGTRTVLKAWGIGKAGSFPCCFLVGGRVPEAEYREDQNSCLFHLQPSAVEGFGHVLHEGLSTGALLATLDAPPMNEPTGVAFLMPARKVSRQNLGDLYETRPETVAATAEAMWSLSEVECARLSANARLGYLSDREAFRLRFREMLEGL